MIFKLYFTILISFLVAFIEVAGKKPKCGENMVAKKCNVCTNTCAFTKSIPPKPIKKCFDKKKECKKNCGYACVCKKGFYLDMKNKCVKKDKCFSEPLTTKRPTTPKCSKNEIFTTCGSSCEKKCSNYKNGPPKCTKECFIGCRCKNGFVRNDITNKCVSKKECPKKIPQCKSGEVFYKCGSPCEPKCSDFNSGPKKCTKQCVMGCFCAPGFVRDDKTKKCVERSQCPKTTTPKPTCPENEHFDECGTACPITCNNYYNQPKVCTMQCIIGCVCNEGYIRDKLTNKCVRPLHCSHNTTYECPENEHFERCSTACPTTCSNYKNPPKICVNKCHVGCVCNKNYVRDEASDKCVKPNECPSGTTVEPETTPVCPKNMVYTTCKSACEPRCGIPENATSVCTLECAGEGCECRSPFALDEHNNCINREECKKPSKGGYLIIHMLRKTVTSMYTLIFRH